MHLVEYTSFELHTPDLNFEERPTERAVPECCVPEIGIGEVATIEQCIYDDCPG